MKNLILKIGLPLLATVSLIALPVVVQPGSMSDGVVRLAAACGQIGECRRDPEYICYGPDGTDRGYRCPRGCKPPVEIEGAQN